MRSIKELARDFERENIQEVPGGLLASAFPAKMWNGKAVETEEGWKVEFFRTIERETPYDMWSCAGKGQAYDELRDEAFRQNIPSALASSRLAEDIEGFFADAYPLEDMSRHLLSSLSGDIVRDFKEGKVYRYQEFFEGMRVEGFMPDQINEAARILDGIEEYIVLRVAEQAAKENHRLACQLEKRSGELAFSEEEVRWVRHQLTRVSTEYLATGKALGKTIPYVTDEQEIAKVRPVKEHRDALMQEEQRGSRVQLGRR